MLDQYKNIEQLKTARKSFSAERLPASKTELFSVNSNQTYVPNTDILNNNIEFHIYSDTSYVTGKHKIEFRDTVPEFRDKITNRRIRINAGIGIDLYKQFEDLQITAGNYNIVLNFFKNLIGNFDRQHLRIDEISPDRKEIRLRAIDDEDVEFLTQITNYIQTVNQTINQGDHRTYLLNFSRNQCVQFINSVVIGEYLYVKLQDPLPKQFKEDFKCWVVEELKPTYLDRVNILAAGVDRTFNQLSNPNWQANFSYDTSTETDLKSWNDLLGSSVQTSQQLIDHYFSGSLSGMKLNINYSDFNNFIFYSSATERLENFRHKLKLIEFYTSRSIEVSGISGSVATTNQADFNTLKNNLIGGFDNFEKYLYYESGSINLTTHDIPVIDATVPQVTGSYIQPVPKTNSTKPYALTSITSSEFKTWYNSLYATATSYDQLNVNSLASSVPSYLALDDKYDEVTTFINMLAQHFDILYTYISNMTRINNREENPKLGMPNELLYSVAKQFGWNLTNGNQYKDLWEYALGVNESGIPITGSNSVGDPSVSGENMTYTVWRRIVNNLPLLLKSKGTKRSIQALMSCYGIPQSFISINEYGGPRLERAPIYEKLNFDYALDLIGNTAGTVTVNYNQPIETVEIRFRTDDVIKNPTMPSTMNLFTIGTNTVTLDYTSGTLGTIQINGNSSSNIELFDGGFLSAILRKDGSKLQVVAKKSKYGKIVAAVSASDTTTFASSGTLTLGGTTGGSRLQGQLQELRFWSSSLGDSAFNNHVSAPAAYDGNIDAYDELVFRLPLTQKINHATTSSLTGVEPNNSGISASFASWTNDTPYDSIEEMYYYDAISLGAGTFDDNKIRLEDNELINNLDVKTRAERSQFDKAPLDSKKLGVYFSPQTIIDEDIIAQLGFTSLDDLIGDPGDINKNEYPDLIRRATDYWKKYADKNDINAYINMFTLFDLSFFKQLDQLIPARTDNLTGLLVQPNILERSRDSILPTIKRFSENYSVSLRDMAPTASANSLQFTGSVANKIVTLTGEDDDQWQAYLTASVTEKYGGTTYSYDYLIRSGSTYITSSSPFWRNEGVLPVIISSSLSEFKQVLNIVSSSYGTYSYGAGGYTTSGSFELAQVQDYLPTGINNQKYAGSKLTSADFNIASRQTIDGGAPVEVRKANPNQLIYQQQTNDAGSFRLT
tara:strand:- start:9831 stop:13367 length:3537 start_codon:yes stop_codon:yes gene_type:complete